MRKPGVFILAAMLLSAACCLGRAAQAEGSDCEITRSCTFEASPSEDSSEDLCDGRHDTVWTADSPVGQFVEISTPEGRPAAGIYIQWNCVPESYSVLESAGGPVWAFADLAGREGFINAYVPLSGQAAKIRIESGEYDWEMSIAEIRVFGPGELPDEVQAWQPPPAKADLMVITAHPDDEHLYFGGTLPYYAGQLGKHTVVVYMTSKPMIRKFEALDGLWKVCVREYPVFLPLANKYSSTVEDAEKHWDGLDNTVGMLVEQIRQFRPDVIVTHDLDGEYGHGAHKLTALAAQKAVDAGADPSEYPDSAERYGAWQVNKCYLHLYAEGGIRMDWNEPLPRFGGKTALEMAREGYAQHVSQHFSDRPVVDSGPYDNARFGLCFSSVGKDETGGDFFENIEPAPEATPSPAATPEPIVTYTAPAPEDAAPADAKPQRASGSANTVARILSLSVALVAFAWLAMKHLTTAKHARRLFRIKRP